MIETLREALAGERAWLVGGALRDRLLGRPTPDLDVVVDGDVRRAARSLGRGAGGASFELSDQFGAWRVVARDRRWQVDLTPLQGGSLDADLAARDLTVNAMAEPLAGGELVDPHGGATDLEHAAADGRAEAFAADPLRTLRVARLATSSGSRSSPRHGGGGPRARARAGRHRGRSASSPSCARIVDADAAVRGPALLDELDLTSCRAARADGAARRRAERLPPPSTSTATRSRCCRRPSTSSATRRPRSATQARPRPCTRCSPSRWPTS